MDPPGYQSFTTPAPTGKTSQQSGKAPCGTAASTTTTTATAAGTATAPDQSRSLSVIDRILADHRAILAVHQHLSAVQNPADRLKWAHQLIWTVSRHAAAEEVVVYPSIEKDLPHGAARADDARHAHAQIHLLLKEVDAAIADVGGRAFADAVGELMRVLTEHMRLEEEVDLPAMAKRYAPFELDEMGRRFKWFQTLAPTRGHPAVTPLKNPGIEAVLGVALSALDRLRDVGREFPSDEELRRVLAAGRGSEE
ncbi:hemerythrin HHE cation binding domain-containing protein [Zopfochytrium polystomum]|nr:hemerythrin HHE cation binding domain-containing protein [Zopfochytrium polystomum]